MLTRVGWRLPQEMGLCACVSQCCGRCSCTGQCGTIVSPVAGEPIERVEEVLAELGENVASRHDLVSPDSGG